MTILGSAYLKPFYSISTNMPLGACWQAEDLDGNKAIIYLRRVEKCHNVYAYRFITWDGRIFKEGEVTSIRKAWRSMVDLLIVNPKTGMIPDLERTVNYYSGRVDK